MYGCYKIKQAATPITVFKKQLNTNQQCLAVNLATMPVLYLVGAGAVMFWVMGEYFKSINDVKCRFLVTPTSQELQ